MRHKKNLFTLALSCALSFCSVAATANSLSDTLNTDNASKTKFEIHQAKAVLVIFNKGATREDRLMAFNSVGKQANYAFLNEDVQDKRFKTLSDGQMVKVNVPKGMSVAAFKQQLKLNPAVRFVIEDKKVHTKAMPNDPLFTQQPSLHQANDQDLDAPEAWDISTGSKDVVVAVIDTGIDYSHPDITANMWVNPDEVPNDGVDNDNNGYVDDVYGIDTWNGDGDPIDGNDHGTNVAGIIGAVGNNSLGMTGINHDVTMVACKAFSDDRGGSTSSIYECMNYLLDLKQNKGLNIRVVNNSYSQEKDPLTDADDIAVWEMMVEKFAQQDVLFVVAASNEFSDNDVITQMPGNLPNENVVTVASTMHNGRFAYSHSNYGLTTVHIGAPGVAVTSTESLIQNAQQPYYYLLQGTSFATPHVAGAAALALSINPNLSAVELKKMLMDTGDKLSSLDQKTISGKRVNLHKMLVAANPAEHLAFEANGQIEVIKGQLNDISLQMNAKNGFSGNANLSVVAPSGIDASLSTSSASDGQSVNLVVMADDNMAVGEHTITLIANGFEQQVSVEVLPGQLNKVELPTQTLELTPWLPDGLISSVDLAAQNSSESLVAYDVKLLMDIDHEKVGELELHLISPSGTKVEFLAADGIYHIHRDIREVFYDFRGESAVGTWSIEVFDNSGGTWLDLDKIVGSIDWTLEVETAGGSIVIVPETCDENPFQQQCINSCNIDANQAHCDVLCNSPSAPQYQFCDSGTIPELTPGVASYISAANKEQKVFSFVVDEAVQTLNIDTQGNNGDADLFVSFGIASTSDTVCRSRSNDSNESCSIDTPQIGTYFITVDAYSAFTDLALVADVVTTNPCTVDCCTSDCCDENCGGNEPTVVIDEANLSSSTQIVREVTLPAGKTLTVESSSGNGDADLLIKFGSMPSLWDKDCYSGGVDNNELCTIDNTQAGTYYIVLDSSSAFSGVSLTASYQ